MEDETGRMGAARIFALLIIGIIFGGAGGYMVGYDHGAGKERNADISQISRDFWCLHKPGHRS